MLFGALAIILPVLVSVGFARLSAWLILFDGVVQLFHAFRSQGVGRVVWKILVAVLYVGVGIWLLMHTLVGLAGLALVMVGFFVEGSQTLCLPFCTPERGLWLDSAECSRHCACRHHDLETLAVQFSLGDRYADRHQHGGDGHHESDDGASCPETCEKSKRTGPA